MKIAVGCSLDLNDLISSLNSLNYDDLFEFIVQLDASVEDWDFTARLIDHFYKQKQIMIKEGII